MNTMMQGSRVCKKSNGLHLGGKII